MVLTKRKQDVEGERPEADAQTRDNVFFRGAESPAGCRTILSNGNSTGSPGDHPGGPARLVDFLG
jgi:hypothetical protein